MAIKGRALPWHDPVLFAELMLSWDMRSHHMAQQLTEPVFFDLGVADMVGYFRLLGLPLPKHIKKAVEVFRYHRYVFIAPPWEEIYEQDCERQQDFQEAVWTYDALVTAYSECGYQLFEGPRVSVERRTRFVLHAIGITTAK